MPLKTIDIKHTDKKGKVTIKKYVMVNTRVQHFRNTYKNWSLNIEWKQCDLNAAICICSAIDENGIIRSQGTAFELAGGVFVNKTSHIENAETSAVGRCLGFLNIGIEESIASAEEVTNAMKQQEQPRKEKQQNQEPQTTSIDNLKTRIENAFKKVGYDEKAITTAINHYCKQSSLNECDNENDLTNLLGHLIEVYKSIPKGENK